MLNILLGAGELFLEGASFFSERDDIGSWDSVVSRRVVVDTLGVASFTGGTSWDAGVASGFPLRKTERC